MVIARRKMRAVRAAAGCLPGFVSLLFGMEVRDSVNEAPSTVTGTQFLTPLLVEGNPGSPRYSEHLLQEACHQLPPFMQTIDPLSYPPRMVRGAQ